MPFDTTVNNIPTVLATPVSKGRIWIDLDNSPHVPFFRPIIEQLTNRHYDVVVTARDAYQVTDLLQLYGIPSTVVGKHYGKRKILKTVGTVWRATRLAAIIGKRKPDIAVCHGSRACILASFVLHIPNVTLFDYEFTTRMPSIKPTWLMVPNVVPNDLVESCCSNLLKYPGIKEDVYLSNFLPDLGLRRRLGIPESAILITVRPPATEAHYHNPDSEALLKTTLRRFTTDSRTKVLLLPRNKRQEVELRSAWRQEIMSSKIVIPERVEDGLNLIWISDIVVSGGGTMNREAAAMGVPVYSIFRGKIGAVDRYLVEQGRLTLLETVQDVMTKIIPIARHRSGKLNVNHSPALETIVKNIEMIMADAKTGSAKLRVKPL